MSDVLLSASGLNTFYGRAHILRDMALEVRRGQVTALLGRNGAGKSTTMKAIIGLVPLVSGDIAFHGQSVARMPSYKVARLGIGYVPEERRIFKDLTVMENLEVGTKRGRANNVQWTAERLLELFPNLGAMRSRLGGRMSGGEQQMLSIARTLMGNPDLLLLDEPSEGVAPKIVEQLAEAIQAVVAEGMSVIVSEQNLHFAEMIASEAIIIEKGVPRYSGRMSDLKQNEAVQKEYLSV
jgi:branched-chain amino acid transport system ATP-binding protein